MPQAYYELIQFAVRLIALDCQCWLCSNIWVWLPTLLTKVQITFKKFKDIALQVWRNLRLDKFRDDSVSLFHPNLGLLGARRRLPRLLHEKLGRDVQTLGCGPGDKVPRQWLKFLTPGISIEIRLEFRGLQKCFLI